MESFTGEKEICWEAETSKVYGLNGIHLQKGEPIVDLPSRGENKYAEDEYENPSEINENKQHFQPLREIIKESYQ